MSTSIGEEKANISPQAELHRSIVLAVGRLMPEKYKPPYTFSTHIGAACATQFRTFADLAEKLKIDVTDLMRQCNGKVPPSNALVKGLAKELDIDESYLNRLADEVRKDLG
jgi:transcriptional regulator with XRE-family HTH domain